MPYGIKITSAIFQRAIEQVIGIDIKNVICQQDGICIGAINDEELKWKTGMVLNKLKNAGLTINKKKKKYVLNTKTI